ncbi:MAG: hypothetical protein WC729_08155 [Sphingomonas sp.]|uniref:hypothetical protein n=1 Tax=Sphingomonas sp. TaxID=28214 RepID=UPI0035663371
MLLGNAVVLAAIAAAQPACAQDVIPPKVYSTTPGGVNVADGSFVYSETDLAIGPLKLERSHVTGLRKPNRPFFGFNMTHNFDIYVAHNNVQPSPPPANQATHRPIAHLGGSASGTYTQLDATPSSISAFNIDAERSGNLTWAGGSTFATGHYVYTDSSGTIYTFSSSVPAANVVTLGGSQRIAEIAFPEGRTQTFSYNASNQLKLVSDSSGYAIVFDYNAAGDVSAACGFDTAQTYVTATSTCTGAALKATYGYASGYLNSVVDTSGQTTTYDNVQAGITCVKPPGYATCKMAMSYNGSVIFKQTMADGAEWNIASGSPDVINDPGSSASDGDGSGTVTDPAGKVTNFRFTKSSPYSITDPNGQVTNYRFTGAVYFEPFIDDYHDGTLLVEATLPEGNKYLAEYNGPFHAITKRTMVAKPGSGIADQVETLGYGSCFSPGSFQNCAKPIWTKDAKGNQTDFTYASWGGLLTEMQPAPTAGAARPLKLNTYVQKYPYIKNSGGSLVAGPNQIWVPDTETLCQTVAGSSTPTCDSGAPITVTTYEYGANGTADNLLVRGKLVTSGGVSLRTCFGYDAQSNKIWETSPRGTASAVCS